MGLKENLKQARLSKNLTLEAVSQKVGISRSTLYKYESGDIPNIPFDRIEKLAKVLGTSPQEIVGWDEDDETRLSNFEELLALAGWHYEVKPVCCIPGINSWLDEEDKEQCPEGKMTANDCASCDKNTSLYYLTDNKYYYTITQKEFEELSNSLIPFIQFKIFELTKNSKKLTKKQFESE